MATERDERWQAMNGAERGEHKILVTVRAGEQGPAEVDTVRWSKAEGAWASCDSDPFHPVTYQDDDLVAWMPFPRPDAAGSSPAGVLPAPAREADFSEEAGSGI